MMGNKSFSSFQLVFIMLLHIAIKYATGACPPSNPADAIQFQAIAPQLYDKNYSDITNTGARPYGFSQSIWFYNRPDLDNPCVHISGTAGRRVEIMVETQPPARLCMKSETSQNLCDIGKQWRCLKAQSNDFYLEFFCDDQCSEADVPFWYRLVIGDNATEDSEDQWCEGRSIDQFPSSLLQLPADFVATSTTFSPGGDGAMGLVGSWLLCALCGLLGAVLVKIDNL